MQEVGVMGFCWLPRGPVNAENVVARPRKVLAILQNNGDDARGVVTRALVELIDQVNGKLLQVRKFKTVPGKSSDFTFNRIYTNI